MSTADVRDTDSRTFHRVRPSIGPRGPTAGPGYSPARAHAQVSALGMLIVSGPCQRLPRAADLSPRRAQRGAPTPPQCSPAVILERRVDAAIDQELHPLIRVRPEGERVQDAPGLVRVPVGAASRKSATSESRRWRPHRVASGRYRSSAFISPARSKSNEWPRIDGWRTIRLNMGPRLRRTDSMLSAPTIRPPGWPAGARFSPARTSYGQVSRPDSTCSSRCSTRLSAASNIPVNCPSTTKY
jgi:hypothetical protein